MVPPKNAFLSLRLPIFGASYYQCFYIFWVAPSEASSCSTTALSTLAWHYAPFCINTNTNTVYQRILILSHFLYHHHCVHLFQWNAFEGMFGVSTALPVVCPSSTEPPNEHMWVMADCPQYIYGPEHHHDHQYQCRPKGKMQKKEGKKLTSVSFSFTLLELIDLFLFYSVQSIFRIFYWELKIHGFGKNFGK